MKSTALPREKTQLLWKELLPMQNKIRLYDNMKVKTLNKSIEAV
jgi:hypothetical protein